MSRDVLFHAERRHGAIWVPIGELFRGWGPKTVIEISPDDDLVTVLTGYTRDYGSPFHSGLLEITHTSGLPADLSDPMRRWLEERKGYLGEDWNPCVELSEIFNFDWYSPNIFFSGFVSERKVCCFEADSGETLFPFKAWSDGRVDSSRLLPFCYNDAELEQNLSDGWPRDEMIFTRPRDGTVEVYWAESHYQFLQRPDWFFEELKRLGPPNEVRVFVWVE